MREEHISLEQLFEEERDAVIYMLEELECIRNNMQPWDEDYYSITHEIIKLTMTRDYLTNRLNNELPPRWMLN